MEKIYIVFCLFFIGSLFPFLIVEFYFQNYFIVGVIAIFAIFVLALCAIYRYLKKRIPAEDKEIFEKIEDVDLLQKKEQSKRPSYYFFRKNFW